MDHKRYTPMDKYRAFYQQYKEKLFSYIMRMCGDYFLSSDILQESFTKYLEHYGTDNNSVSLLYAIARNSYIDNVRKQKKTDRLEETMFSGRENQENQYMVREEYRLVMKCMGLLNDDEREIISLAADGDLTYRQIARITGISENNVKVKIHRTRLKLKEMIQTETGPLKAEKTQQL